MSKKIIGKKRAAKQLGNGASRANGHNLKLAQENQRLRKQLRELQKSRRTLKSERDDFERAVYSLLRKQFKREDWKDFRKEDYFPIDQVFAELGLTLRKGR
jgi:uncharacterized protein YlxW (UPF0749 family)